MTAVLPEVGQAAVGAMWHVLVVDDDRRLLDLLRRFLSANGFRVTTAASAAEARAQLAAMGFDLVLLDVMMPGESGLDLAHDLQRAPGGTPILLLTAMGEADDRIRGLEAGAEDYVVKPFEPRELVLRMRTILRRRPAEAPSGGTVRSVGFGDFAFDIAREQLTRVGEPVHLTTAEASLLKALAIQPGRILSREALIESSRIEGNARTVDVQVTRLRRKIEVDPGRPRWLQTVWGRGYVLRPDLVEEG
ncbi:MAG: response regulator [Alphaproteobacteria bacterium]